MVESLNNMLVNAIECPYVTLLDVIQEKMSKWWNDRRTVAMALTSLLTSIREIEFRPCFAESNNQLTSQHNPTTYHVKGGEIDGVVDIFNKMCTCKMFDIDELPYVHAVVAAHHAQVSVYNFVSLYYTKEYNVLAYRDTIYLVRSHSQWDVPDEVTVRVVCHEKLKTQRWEGQRIQDFPQPESLESTKIVVISMENMDTTRRNFEAKLVQRRGNH